MRVEANELHGTDVKLVSLVKRGANRLPWRITKEDTDDMLDLAKIFTRKVDAPSAPTVHSIIMRKECKNQKGLAAILAKAGLDVSKPAGKGDFIIFAQKAGDPSNDAVLIKSNGDVGFVVENLSKAFSGYDFSSNDFNDVFSTGSFCPSVAMASDLLGVTIGNILSGSESPGDAAGKIAKAVEGFKQYSVTLANSLPAQAFKADTLMKGDVGMSLRGAGSTSYDATRDDKENTGVNDIKPDKSLEATENMKGFTDGMQRPDTNAGSTNINAAIDIGTVDAKLGGPSTPAATADDKKAVFQGNNVSGKGGKNTAISTLSRKTEVEALQKTAAGLAAAGDHEGAAAIYKAATSLAKAGGVVANTMDDEGTDNKAAQRLRENQSGAGASSTNNGQHVTKADAVTPEQVAAIVATLRKSADEYEKVGLTKRAESVRAEAEKLTKDNANGGVSASEDLQPNMATAGNGTSVQATSDDANNTAVGATKKKPDPNLKAPEGMDVNGWGAKVAADMKTMFAELTASLNTTVTDAVGAVQKQVTGLATQVAAVNGRIEKAETDLNGTVHAEPGRDMLGFRAVKEDGESGAPAPLDTGFRKFEPEPNIHDIRQFAKRGRGW